MAEYTYQQLRQKGLKEAFSSAPGLSPEAGIIIRLDGEFRAYYNFAAMYAMKRFVDMLIGDAKVTWEDDYTIAFDVPAGRMQIRGSGNASWFEDASRTWAAAGKDGTMMERIMEHEDDKWEREFVMPMPYPGYARALRAGRVISQTGEDNMPAGEDHAVSRVNRPKPEPKEKVRAPARHRERKPGSGEGMVTVGMIADELGISAREARQKLRKMKIDKPGAAWEWPAKVAEGIKAKIAAFKR